MTIEAAPPLSLKAQQHEEYIDYSEDESATSVATAKRPNNKSFSSNLRHNADSSQHVEILPSEADHQAQAIDVEIDADLVAISVAEDTNLIHDNTEILSDTDTVNVHQLDTTETDGNYFDETENLNSTDITETENAYTENEINWEDVPNNEQCANKDENHGQIDHDCKLAGKDNHFSRDDTYLNESAFEHGEVGSHDIEQALEDPPNVFENLDTDLEATAVEVNTVLGEQQTAESQNTEARDSVNDIDYPENDIDYSDNDIDYPENEMDYPENENSDSAVNDSGGVSEPRLERSDDAQELLGNDTIEQDAEDHTIGEDHESQLQQGIETNVAAQNDEHDGEVADVPEYAVQGETTSDNGLVELDEGKHAGARSSASAETPSNEEMDIPLVTVSYKGIDYPFFYGSPDSEGKECFFSDLSLLHCKMEGVLAGFRRELVNELGPFDELVFQIDELGLEFAESSQPDVFSDITLGQIISVFDSLVKNQNPNASKPLYAYLSTRPNCKRRWLSLVDDAYNGKGLDEVSFYFASRVQSEAPEIMDDEPDLIGEHDNADAVTWPQSPGASEWGDEDVNYRKGEIAEINQDISQYDDLTDGTTEDDNAKLQEAFGEDPIRPEASAAECLDAEATMADNEDALMDESTVALDINNVDVGEVDMAKSQRTEYHGEKVGDVFNPLAWDSEEADVFNTDQRAQIVPGDEHAAPNLDHIIEGVDVNSPDKVTPNTSATSTLNGDEEAIYDNELDLNADLPENEIGSVGIHDQEDELAEIDWREFPGQDDVAKSPSISGKRQRSDADDMSDEEARKGVKRRRS